MRRAWVVWMVFSLLLLGCSDETVSGQKQAVENQERWEQSPLFTTSTGSKAIGIKGKAAILVHEDQDFEVIAEYQKYMWLIWGNRQQLAQSNLEIYGTHQRSKERKLLHRDPRLSNLHHHGSDAVSLSGPTFPKTGLWKLDVYLNGKLHESFVIDVK